MKALISLLDDEDKEVTGHVEDKIISLGKSIIPFLEEEWESNFNPVIQKKIEDLIHNLQYQQFDSRLQSWFESKDQDLLKGMWILATYQYPDLDYEKLLKDLEQLYYEVWLELRNDMHPLDQIKIFNSIFFGKLKFKANMQNFHSPANSMINSVIESKKGNPITLCVVYMLIANKLKMPIYGVNLPNLFILTFKDENTQFYINVFNKGLIFSKSDIDNYIKQLNLKHNDAFYQPCTNLDIIIRAVRNLKEAFKRLGEIDKITEMDTALSILGVY